MVGALAAPVRSGGACQGGAGGGHAGSGERRHALAMSNTDGRNQRLMLPVQRAGTAYELLARAAALGAARELGS